MSLLIGWGAGAADNWTHDYRTYIDGQYVMYMYLTTNKTAIGTSDAGTTYGIVRDNGDGAANDTVTSFSPKNGDRVVVLEQPWQNINFDGDTGLTFESVSVGDGGRFALQVDTASNPNKNKVVVNQLSGSFSSIVNYGSLTLNLDTINIINYADSVVSTDTTPSENGVATSKLVYTIAGNAVTVNEGATWSLKGKNATYSSAANTVTAVGTSYFILSGSVSYADLSSLALDGIEIAEGATLEISDANISTFTTQILGKGTVKVSPGAGHTFTVADTAYFKDFSGTVEIASGTLKIGNNNFSASDTVRMGDKIVVAHSAVLQMKLNTSGAQNASTEDKVTFATPIELNGGTLGSDDGGINFSHLTVTADSSLMPNWDKGLVISELDGAGALSFAPQSLSCGAATLAVKDGSYAGTLTCTETNSECLLFVAGSGLAAATVSFTPPTVICADATIGSLTCPAVYGDGTAARNLTLKGGTIGTLTDTASGTSSGNPLNLTIAGEVKLTTVLSTAYAGSVTVNEGAKLSVEGTEGNITSEDGSITAAEGCTLVTSTEETGTLYTAYLPRASYAGTTYASVEAALAARTQAGGTSVVTLLVDHALTLSSEDLLSGEDKTYDEFVLANGVSVNFQNVAGETVYTLTATAADTPVKFPGASRDENGLLPYLWYEFAENQESSGEASLTSQGDEPSSYVAGAKDESSAFCTANGQDWYCSGGLSLGSGSWSINLVAKIPQNDNATGSMVALGLGGSYYSAGFALARLYNGGTPAFGLVPWNASQKAEAAILTTPISDMGENFHSYTIVSEDAGDAPAVSLYVDGAFMTKATATLTCNGCLQFGSVYNGCLETMWTTSSTIDDFRLYHQALTPTQIKYMAGSFGLGANTWVNGSGDGLWSTAANWSRNAVPAENDDVSIYNASASKITLAGSVTTGTLSLEAAGLVTFEVPAEATLSIGTLALPAGTTLAGGTKLLGLSGEGSLAIGTVTVGGTAEAITLTYDTDGVYVTAVAQVGDTVYTSLSAAIAEALASGEAIKVLSAGSAEIAAGQTLTVQASTALLTVTGAGTVIVDGTAPTAVLAGLTDEESWTGTLWVKNVGTAANAAIDWFPEVGNARSTVRFTNVKGYINEDSGVDFDYTLDLRDEGETKAWYNSSGWSARAHAFAAITGEGTFTDNLGGTCAERLRFKSAAAFTGTLAVAARQVIFGTNTSQCAEGYGHYGMMAIGDGAAVVIAADKAWKAAGLRLESGASLAVLAGASLTTGSSVASTAGTDYSLTIDGTLDLSAGGTLTGTGALTWGEEAILKLSSTSVPTEEGASTTILDIKGTSGAVTMTGTPHIYVDGTEVGDLTLRATAEGIVITKGTAVVTLEKSDGTVLSCTSLATALSLADQGSTLTVFAAVDETVTVTKSLIINEYGGDYLAGSVLTIADDATLELQIDNAGGNRTLTVSGASAARTARLKIATKGGIGFKNVTRFSNLTLLVENDNASTTWIDGRILDSSVDIEINRPVIFENAAATVGNLSGSASFSGTALTVNTTKESLFTGTIANATTLGGTGALVFSGTLTGSLTVDSTATLKLAPRAALTGTLTNNGTLSVASAKVTEGCKVASWAYDEIPATPAFDTEKAGFSLLATRNGLYAINGTSESPGFLHDDNALAAWSLPAVASGDVLTTTTSKTRTISSGQPIACTTTDYADSLTVTMLVDLKTGSFGNGKLLSIALTDSAGTEPDTTHYANVKYSDAGILSLTYDSNETARTATEAVSGIHVITVVYTYNGTFQLFVDDNATALLSSESIKWISDGKSYRPKGNIYFGTHIPDKTWFVLEGSVFYAIDIRFNETTRDTTRVTDYFRLPATAEAFSSGEIATLVKAMLADSSNTGGSVALPSYTLNGSAVTDASKVVELYKLTGSTAGGEVMPSLTAITAGSTEGSVIVSASTPTAYAGAEAKQVLKLSSPGKLSTRYALSPTSTTTKDGVTTYSYAVTAEGIAAAFGSDANVILFSFEGDVGDLSTGDVLNRSATATADYHVRGLASYVKSAAAPALCAFTLSGGAEGDFAAAALGELTVELNGTAASEANAYTLVDATGARVATAESADGKVVFKLGTNALSNGVYAVTGASGTTGTLGVESFTWEDGKSVAVDASATTQPILLANAPGRDGLVSAVSTVHPTDTYSESDIWKGSLYRIPALAKGANSLVALYDCRYFGFKDLGQDYGSQPGIAIDWAGSESTDLTGKTWGAPQLVMDVPNYAHENSAGTVVNANETGVERPAHDLIDPCIGYDEVNGKFVAMGLTGGGLQGGWENNDTVIFTRDAAKGSVWSAGTSIKEALTNCLSARGVSFTEKRAVFQCPGHAIRNTRAFTVDSVTYAANTALLFPMQFFPGNGRVFVAWTTDLGATWHTTNCTETNDAFADAEESSVTELDDGSWYMISKGDSGRRAFRTTDYKTWTSLGNVTSYGNPQGAILKLGSSASSQKGVYVMTMPTSGASSSGERGDIALFFGTDNTTGSDAATAPILWDTDNKVVFWPGSSGTQGYTSLVMLDDNTLGILFEAQKHIYFQRFDVSAWLK